VSTVPVTPPTHSTPIIIGAQPINNANNPTSTNKNNKIVSQWERSDEIIDQNLNKNNENWGNPGFRFNQKNAVPFYPSTSTVSSVIPQTLFNQYNNNPNPSTMGNVNKKGEKNDDKNNESSFLVEKTSYKDSLFVDKHKHKEDIPAKTTPLNPTHSPPTNQANSLNPNTRSRPSVGSNSNQHGQHNKNNKFDDKNDKNDKNNNFNKNNSTPLHSHSPSSTSSPPHTPRQEIIVLAKNNNDTNGNTHNITLSRS